MTSEPGEDREYVARLMVAMDQHTAFLEGAIGMEMTLIFREFDYVNSVAFIVVPTRCSTPHKIGARMGGTKCMINRIIEH
jgi:hypothetical protein